MAAPATRELPALSLVAVNGEADQALMAAPVRVRVVSDGGG